MLIYAFCFSFRWSNPLTHPKRICGDTAEVVCSDTTIRITKQLLPSRWKGLIGELWKLQMNGSVSTFHAQRRVGIAIDLTNFQDFSKVSVTTLQLLPQYRRIDTSLFPALLPSILAVRFVSLLVRSTAFDPLLFVEVIGSISLQCLRYAS